MSASSDLRSARAGPILMRGMGRSGRLAPGAASAGLAAVSGCNPVHPGPIHLLRASLSLRRLRTTPARKPRTECCCQPVACIMAAIVAPVGDCSMAMTRDCFEPGLAFLPLGSIVVCCEGFAAPPAAVDAAAERFLTDF